MKENRFTLAVAFAMAMAAVPAMGHEAHVHGVGKLDIVVEGQRLSLSLETPLENLVGFEHVAKSMKDKKALRDMAVTLRNANALFMPSPAAECRLVSSKLKSDVLDTLEGRNAGKPVNKDAHADLDADYVFMCERPELLKRIDVKLFDQFKRFRKIDARIATPKKQASRRLTPDQTVISW